MLYNVISTITIVNIVIQGTSRSSHWTRWHPRPGPGPRPAVVDLDGTPGSGPWELHLEMKHGSLMWNFIKFHGKYFSR